MQMYQLGEKVVYGGHGVCCVAGQEERVVDKRTVTYLVLEPLGQGGSQFLVPIHNEVAMSRLRPLLTPEELDALLSLDQISPALWIREDNRRKQAYRELISSGDRARILGMLRTLYTHRENQLASGKKVHLCDDVTKPRLVPRRFFWYSMTSACSGLSSGTIIGTSGVPRCAELLETTGVSVFA